MGTGSGDGGAGDVARSQALVRAVNGSVVGSDGAFGAAATATFQIACECRDSNCSRMLEVRPEEYVALRSRPGEFAVHPSHVSDEPVVRELVHYVVVRVAGSARHRRATAARASSGQSIHSSLEAERRLWLQRLIDACNRAAQEIADTADPYSATLLYDLALLRARLQAEFRAGTAAE